jgi:hypothetical protein
MNRNYLRAAYGGGCFFGSFRFSGSCGGGGGGGGGSGGAASFFTSCASSFFSTAASLFVAWTRPQLATVRNFANRARTNRQDNEDAPWR